MSEPKRDHKLRIVLTEAEFALIREAAKAAGLPMATWCRMVLLREANRGEAVGRSRIQTRIQITPDGQIVECPKR